MKPNLGLYMSKRIDQLKQFLNNLHDFMICNGFELTIYVNLRFIMSNNSEDQ